MTAQPFRPSLWVPGDWNAFFGFGTNIVVNMLVLTGLLRFVLGMPDELVFGRILPATGLMLFLSTTYYARLAYQLAVKTGRTDVCALPSGVSVPHMFVVVFVIMLPIATQTGDPIKGWEAGLAWVFLQGCLLMIGGFIAPVIRLITPRAALLGTLAGVSIAFISMRPALEMFMTPVIGIVCFAIIVLGWFGGVKYGRIPAGLVAIAVGTLVAWGSTLFGVSYGGMSLGALGDALTHFGFSAPRPVFGHVFSGFEYLGIILVTAIPFGIYDLVEAMDNVESAAVAGDDFPTTRVLTADGVISTIGCLMGNPFNLAVYIGHPGWKAMGGRIGYSAATGLMVIVLATFGILSIVSALVPLVAISPILLYIGMLIGAQAFQETPKSHAPAIVLSLLPHIAAWGKLQIDNALGAAGTNVAAVGTDALGKTGILYHGLEVLGGGAIVGGLVLGAIAVFVIDRQFLRAGSFAVAGAMLTFFGFMHGESIGIGRSPEVAAAYLIVAGILVACSKLPRAAPITHDADVTTIDLVVVGAHLPDMPLASQLLDLGARFDRFDETAACYQLFMLPGSPERPGLVRVDDGASSSARSIEVGVWKLELDAVGRFSDHIPSPLCLGWVSLANGSMALGFLCESCAVQGAKDITSFGGWRAYLASRPLEMSGPSAV